MKKKNDSHSTYSQYPFKKKVKASFEMASFEIFKIVGTQKEKCRVPKKTPTYVVKVSYVD